MACWVSIKRGKSETLRWKERIPIYGVVGVDVLKNFEHFECLAWQRKNIQTYSIGKSKNEKSTNQRSSRWPMMDSEQNGEKLWLFWSKLGATCLVPLIRVVWSSWSCNVQQYAAQISKKLKIVPKEVGWMSQHPILTIIFCSRNDAATKSSTLIYRLLP